MNKNLQFTIYNFQSISNVLIFKNLKNLDLIINYKLEIKNSCRRQAGFTLVEILVAIVIMLVVFGFVFASVGAIQKREHDQQRTTDLQNIQSALAQFYADQQFYPDATLSLSSSGKIDDNIGNPNLAVSTKTYLSTIPKDPIGPVDYCYKPQLNFSSSLSCDNSSNATACQYYFLCAQLEDGPSSVPNCSTGCSTFNFKLNPNISSQ